MSLFDKLKSLIGGKPAADPPPPVEPPVAIEAPHPVAPSGASVASARGRTTSTEDRRSRRAKADGRLEAEARALVDPATDERAVQLLARRTILFARHETGVLPCLCRACLRPDVARAEHAGIPFVRDFVVAKHRTLFFWVPASLLDEAERVRASVRAELRGHLARPPRSEAPSIGTNPFTGAPMTLGGRRPRPVLNPFTGKRVP
jgi:hypothetical protein